MKIMRLMLPLLILLTVSLQGCGWLMGDKGYFRDRGDDYRKARTIPAMKAPEGKAPQAVEPLYPIPVERTDALLGKEFEVPRPAPLLADPEQGVVRIQKLGEQQWILLDGAPGEIWPRVRAFLISNQIGIDREDAPNGVMETGWLQLKGSADRREKYRYRVDQGVQRNTAEVYITQMGYTHLAGEEAKAPEWKDTSTSVERETWMVKELAGYLADTTQQGSVSLLAQGISTANKVYIVRGADGTPMIDLRLNFERAWASLGRALPRGGFTVQDLDRSAGIYYVKFEPSEKKDDAEAGEGEVEVEKADKPTSSGKGFFKRMFSWWGDDDEDENNPAVGRAYRLQMREAPEGVTIEVRREDGAPFEEGENEFLLGVIRGHLA
jgi:outer membrane protein assembly factor BamC